MPTWIEYLDPIRHVGASGYISFWQHLFATLLLGFWGRLFAVIALGLSFWFGVRRRNFMTAAACFFLAVGLAYGAAVLRFIGILL
jgi:hypothetical protein